MFYNTEMLTKRGPLARVWMASHLSTKLTKANLLQTSIPSSVSSILGESLLPMALRLSGQLLLGVARIYSRKTKYLLDDCNETLAKVKKAFRPGAVDMDDNGEGGVGGRGGAAAITLGMQEGGLEDVLNQYDYLGGNWDDAAPVAGPSNANKKGKGKANVSNAADITLPDHSYAAGGWGDDGLAQFDNGEGGGIDSQFLMDGEGFFDEDFDLGIMDDEPEAARGEKRPREEGEGDEEELRSEGDASVEAGRDAAVHASDRGSVAGLDDFGFDKDAMGGDGGEEWGGGMEHFEHGGEGFELDEGAFDLAMGNDVREKTPVAPSLNGDVEMEDEDSLGLTPKTLADLAKQKAALDAKRPIKKAKKQVVDAVTELDWEDGRGKQPRFKEASFLPRSRLHLRLLELASDPSSHLPQPLHNSTNELFAPLGLAPELALLYTLPTRRERIKLEGRARDVEAKRAASVEQGRERQQSLVGFEGFEGMEANDDDFANMGGGDGFGDYDGGEAFDAGLIAEDAHFAALEAGDDSFAFDLGGGGNGATPKASKNKKQKTAHTPGDDDEERDSLAALPRFGDEEDAEVNVSIGPLAVFDLGATGPDATQASQSQAAATQSQSMGATEEDELENEGTEGTPKFKWSKNTVKAIEILKDELELSQEEQDAERVKALEFDKVAEQATRRAAASFFFELLVLGTRECVKIDQKEAYGKIEVRAKERLWHV